MEHTEELTLMNSRRIERSVKRIAHQIFEANREGKPITIFGIKKRGYAVARFLYDCLNPLSETSVSLHRIRIDGEEEVKEKGNGKGKVEGDVSLQNQYVLLVDDVIFTGNTMFRALHLLFEQEAPEEVHTVVLVDRGHRRFPVTAEFVGMELPTKLNEHVTVDVEGEQIRRVLLSPSLH